MAYTVKEGKRQFLKFTMTYSADWSDTDLQGDPVQSSEVSEVTFIIKKNAKDTAAVLTKNVTDGGIVWEDGSLGKIIVEFNDETMGKAGNYKYELVVKLTGGDYVSVESGDLIIEKSVAGNPA